MERRRGPPATAAITLQDRPIEEGQVPMHSVATSRTQNTTPAAADVEAAAMLCLSLLDHRMATRDRYTGEARAEFIQQAVREARMALDGASINDILEARQ